MSEVRSDIPEETRDKMVDVCQGNPGALTLLVQLSWFPHLIDYLHEHGPRGAALWVLYKDGCFEDVARLAEILDARASEFRP